MEMLKTRLCSPHKLLSSGSLIRLLKWAAISLYILSNIACTTTPALTNHTFEFDARWDSPGIEVLNYRYGNTKQPGATPPEYMLKIGKTPQQIGISGDMLRGDDLYVKWRIKSSGEVYEDTVNLKDRLPNNITKHSIRFIVHGSQLYVYLITPEKLIKNPCPPKEQLCRIMDPSCPSADHRIFSGYCSRKIIRLYPGQAELLNIK